MEIERNPIIIQAEPCEFDEVDSLRYEIIEQINNMVHWELLYLKDFLDKHMSNDWNSG